MCHFRHLSWTKFCWYKPLLLLSSIYLPFSLCKILKKFLEQIQSYEHAPFLGPKWSICPTQLFFLEKINIIFIYLLTPFHCAKLKKNSYSGSTVIRMYHFWAQNGPFAQMRIFSENRLISLVPFFHAYLYAKNQGQNTEISLAQSHFGYNLRTRFFPSM